MLQTGLCCGWHGLSLGVERHWRCLGGFAETSFFNIAMEGVFTAASMAVLATTGLSQFFPGLSLTT